MSVLLTGTLAVDHIADVVDGFQAGDLNGKLGAPTAHWGGCGMNLAYGFAKANQPALPWVFYGGDIPEAYLQHISTPVTDSSAQNSNQNLKARKESSLDTSALCQQPQARCAAAYIFTRSDGSQLTGFYPGTTKFQAPSRGQQAAIDACSSWLAGPEDDATLLSRLPHIDASTQLYWMPGQYAEVTRQNVLEPMLARKPHLLVNDKEWRTLQQVVGASALDQRVGSVFITHGEHPMRYRLAGERQFHEHATPGAKIIDPTGCGDAFCAALVAGISAGVPVDSAIAQAQTQAALCLSQPGAQTY